jgi:hypothetical protein
MKQCISCTYCRGEPARSVDKLKLDKKLSAYA